jgi:hypothetical protein
MMQIHVGPDLLLCEEQVSYLDTAGPVGVHGPVLVVETLQLQLQVWSPH